MSAQPERTQSLPPQSPAGAPVPRWHLAQEWRADERHELLHRTGRACAEAGPDLSPVLETVVREVGVALADACGISLLDDDDVLRLVALHHPDAQLKAELVAAFANKPVRLGEGLLGSIAAGGETFVVPELEPESIAALVREESRADVLRYAPRSILVAPLRARGRGVGLLHLARTRPGLPFTDGDRLLVEEIGDLAALVIDAARLYGREAEARRRAELMAAHAKRLHELTSRLSRAVTPEEVAATVLEQACSAVASGGGFLAAPDDEPGSLVVIASKGPSGPAVGSRVPLAPSVPEFPPAEAYRTLTARFDEELPGDCRAGASVPLTGARGGEGVLALGFAAPRAFDADTRTLLETMGGHAAHALERARAYESERLARETSERTRARVEVLLGISSDLVRGLDVQETVERLCRRTVPAIADWCVVHLGAAAEELRLAASWHESPALAERLRALFERWPTRANPGSPVTQVARTLEALVVPEVDDALLRRVTSDPEHLDAVRAFRAHSWVVAPLLARGRLVGVASFFSGRRGRTYGSDDLALMAALARQAGQALENAELHAAERAARARAEAAERRLGLLARASVRLAESLEPRRTLEAVARVAVPEFASLVSVDLTAEGRADEVVFAAADPVMEEEARTLRGTEPLGPDHPIRVAFREGRPVLLPPEAGLDRARGPGHRRFLERHGLRGGLVVPLVARGRTLGVLGCRRGEPYSEDDRAFAEELGRRAGLAIDNAWLFEDARRSEAESRAAADRLALLAEASQLFGASLDPDAVAGSVVRLVVRRLATMAGIDLLGRDGVLRSVERSHVDPSRIPLVRALPEPSAVPDGHPIPTVLRTGEALTLTEIADFTTHGVDTRHVETRRELGMRSALFLPLAARGRPFGVLWFCSDTRDFAPADLEVARQLADRAALALDNARLHAESREAIGLRDDFLSIAGHELRTPLTTIMMHVESMSRTLSRGIGRQEAFPAKLGILMQQIGRLERLVNDLLDVSRITAGRLTLAPEPMDLAVAAREVTTRFEEAATNAGCTLSLSAPDAVPGAWDRLRLEQVLTNLVTNALKYGAGRPVEIAVQALGHGARLRVRDHGVGVGAQDQARIFERFERAVGSHEFGGLGLGLWISKRIVESHGGRITVESTPGRGAEFTVDLPGVSDPVDPGSATP